MSTFTGLSTAQLKSVFTVVVESFGGSVTDAFCDARRLFVRSVLPRVEEIRAGDGIKGGVAMRCTDDQLWVHPFTFRLVCSNGAILARTTRSVHIERLDWLSSGQAADVVAEAICDCCGDAAFEHSVEAMKSAADSSFDAALNLLPMIARMSPRMAAAVMEQYFDWNRQDSDRSRFGLLNVYTARARDTADPDERWQLEELGGAIALAHAPRQMPPGRRALTPVMA